MQEYLATLAQHYNSKVNVILHVYIANNNCNSIIHVSFLHFLRRDDCAYLRYNYSFASFCLNFVDVLFVVFLDVPCNQSVWPNFSVCKCFK